ncbi:MAG: DUF4255 domain-containing protein [Bacteroidota bacterium]
MILFYCLDFIKHTLNAHFKNSARWGSEKVVLTSLSTSNQNVDPDSKDKLLLTLVNISQETTLKNLTGLTSSEGAFKRGNPPQSFNVDFLLSANCSKYEESIKLLSDAINYLQGNHFFDHSNSPTLSTHIEKLSLSILDRDISEMVHIWSAHGAQYLPSLAYRSRIVVIDGSEILETVPELSSNNLRKG